MTIHTCWSRIAFAATAATTALFFGGPAAGAAPVRTDQTVSLRSCPDIDALTQPLLSAGFSAQAAKNYAVLTHRDCIGAI